MSALRASGKGGPPPSRDPPATTPSLPRTRGRVLVRRGLVLREAALEHAAGEDADEAAVLRHRHALQVALLERVERLVERHAGVEREQRLLRDVAGARGTGV